jgi:serine/threonine protein kinase/Tfp pilus assembly protein PilF
MIGETIAHYKILEKLGQGGMGEVYRAEDTKLKRIVALKILPADLVRDQEARERFLREAQAASSLQHENICAIHEIGETPGGRMFICMDCYEGTTLKERIAGAPLPVREAMDIADQIAAGLSEAHGAKIVHRDIKPANVMVTRRGVAKILDFGLAKPAGMATLTKVGSTMGTVAYMSPEQARGDTVDHRTDIWSLGAILYEMIAGKPPFGGEYESAVLYSIAHESPEPITALRSGVPLELERIVNKCLAKDAAERYQTAADFSADLRRLKREISERAPLSAKGASSPKDKRRARRTAAIASGAAVVFLTLLAIFDVGGVRDRFVGGRRASEPGRIESLAILPFVNVDRDPDTDYLSDEIPASITANLSRLSGLRVVPRSSAFRYRGSEGDLAAVGRKLNVRAILTGQVRARGEDLGIRAELVDVANDRQLWGENYSLKLSDILAIEENIIDRITDALQLRLTETDRDRLSKSRTDNAEAHRLYLKGRYFWNKRSEEGIRNAVSYFQKAIEEDPSYALAYTGLADSYSILAAFGIAAPRDVFPKAKAAASRALEIDSTLAEAHVSLALILQHYEWNWLESEKEYKRAIELDPTYATALHWYGLLLLTMRRDEEAIETSENAVRLDPLSLPIGASLGTVYLVLHQYEKAEAQCMKVIEMDSSFAMARSVLAVTHIEMGLYDRGINELQAIAKLPTSTPEDIAYLGYGYARGGRTDEARRILADLSARAKGRYVPPSFFALIYAGLGEMDESFKWIERAYEERDFYLEGLPRAIEGSPASADPRAIDLVRRMGLSPPPPARVQ